MCIPVNTALALGTSLFENSAMTSLAKTQSSAYARGFASDMEALSARTSQIARASSEQIGARALEGLRAKGQVTALMADSGVVGNSAARILREVGMDTDRDIAALRNTAEADIEQVGRQRDAAQIDLQNRMDSIRRPSPVGVGLQLFTTGFASRNGTKVNELSSTFKTK